MVTFDGRRILSENSFAPSLIEIFVTAVVISLKKGLGGGPVHSGSDKIY